jgi:hypothetical protein
MGMQLTDLLPHRSLLRELTVGPRRLHSRRPAEACPGHLGDEACPDETTGRPVRPVSDENPREGDGQTYRASCRIGALLLGKFVSLLIRSNNMSASYGAG